MSRITSETNPLGTFNYAYMNDTSGSSKGDTRLASITYPNGQITNFSYWPNELDERLKQISNVKSTGELLSQFSYSYNPAGEITQWPQIQNNTSKFYSVGYDQAGQVTSARAGSGSALPAGLDEYFYSYDSAANRTSVQKNITTRALLGGTATNGDTITVTVSDVALPGGSQAVTYTVQSGDTLTTIATKLAAAIAAQPALQGLGVTAVTNGNTTISLKSTSPNVTTYSKSITGTETLTFGQTANFIENVVIGGTKTTGDVLTLKFYDPALSGGTTTITYTVGSSDTLTTMASGLTTAINGNSSLSTLGVTATSVGPVIAIRSASTNATTYSQSVSTSATETITLSVNPNPPQTFVVGGTLTTSDQLRISVYNSALSGGGPETVSYTTTGGDTPTSMATALKNAINANTNLQNIGVSAASSGPLVTITSDSPNITTYRNATAASATETITFNAPSNGLNTVTVDGTVTTSDVVTINIYDGGLTGGTKAISYTVPGGATTTSIATNLATNINADTDLIAIGVTATSSSNVVNLKSASMNATTYSTSVSSGATETLTLSPTTSSTAYGYNALNELTNISSGGLIRWQGTSNKAIASAQTATPVVRLNYARSFGTSYSFPNYNSTDEVLSTSMGAGKDLITVGGSKRTGDNVQIKVSSPELSSGSTTVSYVVQSADTLSTIATALASALTSNTTLSGIGLSATASSAVISVFTYPTYSKSVSGTESVTLGPNMQGTANATIGGTVTTSDTASITVSDPRLSGGSKTKTYTVASGNKLTDIAAGLASAINSDTDLQTIGVSAIANPSLSLPWTQQFSGDAPTTPGLSENRVSITDAQPSTKTNPYQVTVSGFGYSPAVTGIETITFSTNTNGNTTATIGGTKTTADVLNITAYSASLPNGSKTISYTVLSGDNLTSIATGLKNAINADTDLTNAGITATSSSTVITISSSGGLGRTLTYDLNGNLTSDGVNTYEWDVENRLTKITYPGSGNRTEFSYDAVGRRFKIVEVTGGTTSSTKQFVPNGLKPAEERDGSGTLTKQFFSLGQINGTSKSFYAFDHLHSTRELTDNTGTLEAQYNYDPFGKNAALLESVSSDFKFAGYYWHARSNLAMTMTRQYSADLGRFITRDPLEERAGSNLYRYTGNRPLSRTDLTGLCDEPPDCEFNPDCSIPISAPEAVHQPFSLIGSTVGDEPWDGQHYERWLRLERDYRTLHHILDDALATYNARRFSPAFGLGGNEPTASGNDIDFWFKYYAYGQASLKHLTITPAFVFGPDIFNGPDQFWWDVTTEGEWPKHQRRYTYSFGRGYGLIYYWKVQGLWGT